MVHTSRGADKKGYRKGVHHGGTKRTGNLKRLGTDGLKRNWEPEWLDRPDKVETYARAHLQKIKILSNPLFSPGFRSM